MTRFREEIIGNQRLILGDAIEVLPTLSMHNAIIADPPYAIPTQAAAGRQKTKTIGDLSIVEFAMRAYLSAALDRLLPTGRVFIFCDGVSYPVIFRALYGELQTALLIWNKGQIGMGREFRKSHELILHGWTSDTPIFSDGVGRPDILNCAPVSNEKKFHPAEKPTGLLTDLLRICSGKILDPFSGSCSVAVACQKLGLSSTSIEIEPKYFDIACKRVEAAAAQPDMLIESVEKPTQTKLGV